MLFIKNELYIFMAGVNDYIRLSIREESCWMGKVYFAKQGGKSFEFRSIKAYHQITIINTSSFAALTPWYAEVFTFYQYLWHTIHTLYFLLSVLIWYLSSNILIKCGQLDSFTIRSIFSFDLFSTINWSANFSKVLSNPSCSIVLLFCFCALADPLDYSMSE